MSGFWEISVGIILVKSKNLRHDFILIQLYAPTSSASDADMANFYDDVEVALKKCKHNEIPIIMGDFNAKVGNNTPEKTIGNNGLRTKNDRGITLMEWCHKQNLCITNTWFKKSKEKLWTWKIPDDQTGNQIDYILIPQKFRITITDVFALSTADCDSDHNPLVVKFRL